MRFDPKDSSRALGPLAHLDQADTPARTCLSRGGLDVKATAVIAHAQVSGFFLDAQIYPGLVRMRVFPDIVQSFLGESEESRLQLGRQMRQVPGQREMSLDVIRLCEFLDELVQCGLKSKRLHIKRTQGKDHSPHLARILPELLTRFRANVGNTVLLDLGNATTRYYTVLVATSATFVGLALIVRSPFGRILQGIKSNEQRMRALGYPVTPVIFTVASIAILGNALWNDLVKPIAAHTDWGPSAAGLIVIAAGLPVYYLFRRHR